MRNLKLWLFEMRFKVEGILSSISTKVIPSLSMPIVFFLSLAFSEKILTMASERKQQLNTKKLEKIFDHKFFPAVSFGDSPPVSKEIQEKFVADVEESQNKILKPRKNWLR